MASSDIFFNQHLTTHFISGAQRDWGMKENSGGLVICHHTIINNTCGARNMQHRSLTQHLGLAPIEASVVLQYRKGQKDDI